MKNQSNPKNPEWGWMDGRFVPFDECRLHVRTQAVMVAASVFEGIRAYWNADSRQLFLFRIEEHLERLRQSMKIMRMGTPLVPDAADICAALLARNGFAEDLHMMLTAYVGEGENNVAMGRGCSEGLFVTALARPRSPALDKGLRVCVSSWRRISDSNCPPRVKAAGNYQNARIAIGEAWANGYDNAILLNDGGKVSEGPAACVMMIRRGELCTPPITDGILESVTRDSLIRLAREKLGLRVVERSIDRTELYVADEIFLCGSGMEVAPIIEIDRITVGNGGKGAVTERLQKAYFDVATGRDADHPEWRVAVTQDHAALGEKSLA
jgi:branched-chain amino acid aminotransferase group I